MSGECLSSEVSIPYADLKDALSRQTLFDGKVWRLSPKALSLASNQYDLLPKIGNACLAFYQSIERLYLKSVKGESILRNESLIVPWVADYYDRGKPGDLVTYSLKKKLSKMLPSVIRPDLILTDNGFILTELDSVPGGIGLTGFLNEFYSKHKSLVIGGVDGMWKGFYESLVSLVKKESPVIGIGVSDESLTYRPEMEWLAQKLKDDGKKVEVFHVNDLEIRDGLVYGQGEPLDLLYRFWELFDLEELPIMQEIIRCENDLSTVVLSPMRPFQEEKLSLALLHHPELALFWKEQLREEDLVLLNAIVPRSWVVDPEPVPPHAAIIGPRKDGNPVRSWLDLADVKQKERNWLLKVSGFHPTAWGARSVTVAQDSSREEWTEALRFAVESGKRNLYVLQDFHKPARIKHSVYTDQGEIVDQDGRLRLCPYYFVINGEVQLRGALATFCPPDKKIIHGMEDAVLLPTASPN